MGFDTSFPPLDVEGRISCAGHLSVSPAAMETGIAPILKLPHSSSYTPQKLLKAGGKGRLIKKSLISLAGSTAWGRRVPVQKGGLLTAPCSGQDAGARQKHCMAWGKQVHKANRLALRWQQDHFIRSLFIKNKHTTFKKKKNRCKAGPDTALWRPSTGAQKMHPKMEMLRAPALMPALIQFKAFLINQK